MNKHELREQARLHRRDLNASPEALEQMSSLFFEHFPLGETATVAAYWPVGRELDVRFLIDDLIRRGHRVCLPDVPPADQGRVMSFHVWDGQSPLQQSAHGSFLCAADGQRVDPDTVLVPLLAFDRRGYRLGQGGGHYDATLADLRSHKDITVIGVGYGEQAVLFNLPTEDHDEPLDYVLTPAMLHDFR